jgi:hypothetical protein
MSSAVIETMRRDELCAIEGALARFQVDIGVTIIMGKEIPKEVIKAVSDLLLRRRELSDCERARH